jgi:NADP-dependent 3-hydroxy acid dehydrogenase YdfG
MSIAGKTVLITGGNAGIGLATATALAEKGAEIILAARSEEKLKQAADQIKSKTGNQKIKYCRSILTEIYPLSSRKNKKRLYQTRCTDK